LGSPCAFCMLELTVHLLPCFSPSSRALSLHVPLCALSVCRSPLFWPPHPSRFFPLPSPSCALLTAIGFFTDSKFSLIVKHVPAPPVLDPPSARWRRWRRRLGALASPSASSGARSRRGRRWRGSRRLWMRSRRQCRSSPTCATLRCASGTGRTSWCACCVSGSLGVQGSLGAQGSLGLLVTGFMGPLVLCPPCNQGQCLVRSGAVLAPLVIRGSPVSGGQGA